jgi:hypothetical protein
MAMTATITKISAVKERGHVEITLNLKVNDGATDVIDQDFTEWFSKRTGETIADVQERFRLKMQESIDNHNDETPMPSASNLSIAIADLEASLSV